jgi:hypothetical protein
MAKQTFHRLPRNCILPSRMREIRLRNSSVSIRGCRRND